MIKPRYIKSLTFLLLCNMALLDRKQLLCGPSWLTLQFPRVSFWSTANLRNFIKTEIAKTGEHVGWVVFKITACHINRITEHLKLTKASVMHRVHRKASIRDFFFFLFNSLSSQFPIYKSSSSDISLGFFSLVFMWLKAISVYRWVATKSFSKGTEKTAPWSLI